MKVPVVYITRDEFNVTTLDGATAFLRSMYNFKDVAIQLSHARNILTMMLKLRSSFSLIASYRLVRASR
jgi:hypothetical protein